MLSRRYVAGCSKVATRAAEIVVARSGVLSIPHAHGTRYVMMGPASGSIY